MPVSHESLESLGDLVVFTAVVDHGGFTAAGDALGLSKSTVSKRVARLEERLGARLLHRTTRTVRPSEAGDGFHERCVRVLEELAEAETAMKGWMERWLAESDLVTREEFDAVREMATRAREENERLAARVAELEAKLAEKPKG